MRFRFLPCILALAMLRLALPLYASAAGAEKGLAAEANARAAARSAGIARSGGISPAPSAVYTGSPVLAPGAVTVRDREAPEISDSLDDYDSGPVASIADPIEPWNRFWFRFNDIFYMYVASPVYTGWTRVTPQFLRTGLNNIFYELLFPTRFINSLLQFRFFEAGVEFSRFMMNLMGSAGTVNLAASKKTIVPVDASGEDFGQTLGRWGFGQGFYIVWPFIGPCSLRDTFGRIGDAFTDPIFYISPWYAGTATELGLRFNDLGEVLPAYEGLRSIAVDPYIAMREAWVSSRKAQVDR